MNSTMHDALLNAVGSSLNEKSDSPQASTALPTPPRKRNVAYERPLTQVTVEYIPEVETGPDKPRVHLEPVQTTLDIEDDYSAVTLTLAEGEGPLQVLTDSKLFHVLRDALSKSKGADYFMMIQFASQVTQDVLPCIKDPAELILYFDPLLPFRAATEHFNLSGSICLLKFPSRADYYRAVVRKARYRRPR